MNIKESNMEEKILEFLQQNDNCVEETKLLIEFDYCFSEYADALKKLIARGDVICEIEEDEFYMKSNL